jgi:septal ring factor EnvC (AmiA/AmiB activator)
LLLNQKDPGQTGRDLSYYRYIAKSQQDLAKKLESQLSELNLLADAIQEKNERLQEIAKDKQRQRQELVSQQQEKKELLTQLSQTINTQRNQIQKLAADEKRVTQLINRLNAMIKQQEIARAREAAKQKLAEKQEAEKRAAAQAKAKAERAARQAKLEQAAKSAGKPAPTLPPEPKEEPTPSPSTVNNSVPDASQAGLAFTSLKGKMRLPAKGEIIGRFGAARGEGGTWKGLFIRTNTGEPVHAVASGRIVFADWLRGFGNLMIIDHGGGYMSLYGANESLLKRIGDTVKAGDNIANAGNSGGMADSGVYFEIRQNSRPLDPAAWVK